MAEIKKQKVALTELLRNTIKSLRLTYKKNGVVLSKELGKGASYISQIESGKIQDIEYDMIHTILQQITNLSNKEYDNFIKDYILNLIQTLSADEYFSELWIHIYLLQDMPVGISDSLLEFIKTEFANSHFGSSQELIEILNKNEDLTSGSNIARNFYSRNHIENKLFITVTKMPNGNWHFSSEVIFLNLPNNYLELILNKKITSISYIYLKRILFILCLDKDEVFNETKWEEYKKIMSEQGFLHSAVLYYQMKNANVEKINPTISSIQEKENSDPIFFYDNEIPNNDKRYEALKTDIFEKITYAFEKYKEKDISYTCDIMEKIISNLNSDLGLIVSILSSDLSDLDISTKLTFWDEYKKLVQRFSKDNIDS